MSEWQLVDSIRKTRIEGDETERGVLACGADVRGARDVQDVACDKLVHHGAVEAPRLQLKAVPHRRVDACTARATKMSFYFRFCGSTERHKKEKEKRAACWQQKFHG